MRVLAMLAAIGMLNWAAPAAAQEGEVRRTELALQLVDTIGLVGNMEFTMEELAPFWADWIRIERPDWSDTQIEQYVVMLREEFLVQMPDLREDAADAYAGRFTEEELAVLVDFFSSGTGRRLVEEQTGIQVELGEITDHIGMIASINAMNRMERDSPQHRRGNKE
jgi:hypothetical protein